MKHFFTGAVSLIDLDTGLSSRFLSAHPEELGDISDVVVPAPGQSNHGLSDPRPPWPFASRLPPHRMHFTNVVQCLGPQHYCSSSSDPCMGLSCRQVSVLPLWRSKVQLGCLFLSEDFPYSFFAGSTIYRRMHLAQRSWWSFCFPCRRERDFEDITYCSSRTCWSTLH